MHAHVQPVHTCVPGHATRWLICSAKIFKADKTPDRELTQSLLQVIIQVTSGPRNGKTPFARMDGIVKEVGPLCLSTRASSVLDIRANIASCSLMQPTWSTDTAYRKMMCVRLAFRHARHQQHPMLSWQADDVALLSDSQQHACGYSSACIGTS